jgi:hypothetical protein
MSRINLTVNIPEFKVYDTVASGRIIIYLANVHVTKEEFISLINKAAQCSPDLSPGMKELIDVITQPDGAVLQDYYSQANVKKPRSS